MTFGEIMKKPMLFLSALLIMVGSAYATPPAGTITVTGGNITDSTGTKLVSGTIYFAPALANGNPTSYRLGSSGQALARPVSALVTNGAFSITLPDTSITFPVNVCFSTSVIDNASGDSVLGAGYSCVQPTSIPNSWCSSSSCNFDAYPPNLAPLVTVQIGPQGVPGPPLHFVGAWSSSSTYVIGDTVSYNNNIYTSLIASNLNNTPSSTPADWSIAVSPASVIAIPSLGQTIAQPAGTYTQMNAPALQGNFLTTDAQGSTKLTLRAWGNSQTAGYGAGPDCPIGNLTCTSVFAWPSVFSQTMGWTIDNQAVSSSDCADLTYQGQNKSMWDVTYPILDNSRSIYAHFRNDQSQYGPLPYRVDFARGCIEAQMAWLAIPEVSTTTGNPSKFRATSGLVGKTGTWTSVGEPNTASMSTTQAGATMTFQVRGTTAYIATSRKNPSNATYTITLDGQLVEDPTLQSTTFSQAMDVGSGGFPTSEAIIPYLIRMPGLNNGIHIIEYTCVNPAGDSCRVFYGAGAQTDNSTANGPIVYSMSPVNNADAEATGNFAYPVTQLYLDEWHRILSELSGDGLQIVGLDVTNLNVYWPDNQNIGDGIHPNTAGQAAIGAAMVAKATLASTPQDRVEAKATNTSTGYGGFGAGAAPSPSGDGSTNSSYHIPKGILWSSTGPQTGQVYFGFDGAAYLARIANDPTNALGFGAGRIFTFNSPDGVGDNLAVPGQFTSYTTSTGNGGTYMFTNGSNSSYLTQAGSSPIVSTWANRAVLAGTGAGIVYDAAGGGSSNHTWQINSGNVAILDNAGWHSTVPYAYNGVDLPVVATPTVGQAACIKAAGPPVVIGFCSTVVSSSGACTCN